MHTKASVSCLYVVLGMCTACLCVPPAQAAGPNSWINPASGKWETTNNWSNGEAPSVSDSADLITNVNSKTVTIDDVTTNTPSALTINNLTLSAPLGSTNTLVLSAVGATLVVSNSVSVNSGGSMLLSNSALHVGGPAGGAFTVDGQLTMNSGTISVSSNMLVGSSANSTSTVNVAGGQLVVTNGVIGIGNGGTLTNGTGVGTMTVSNATVLANTILLGSSAGGQGQLTILTNGLVSLIGSNASLVADGETIVITGGDLYMPNSTMLVARNNTASIVIGSGSATCEIVEVGDTDTGTLTMQGGQITITSEGGGLEIGGVSPNTGAGWVWMTGGALTATAYPTTGIIVGNSGAGQMVVSNGSTVVASTLFVGTALGQGGTLTVAGGVSSVYSNLTIGSSDCAGVGTVIITNGSLFVTNAAHNAVLDVESGTLTLNGGTLVVDILVTTNPCSSFGQTGGTLILPSFVITSITRVNNNQDIVLVWNGQIGTNIVQVSQGTANGSYANNFVDLATNILTSAGSTSYTDVGGGTYRPSRYYRINLRN
ncbi:MAG: hypothetical protein ACLPT4_16370 [Verrucomicrobiia bacterium]